MIKTEDLATSLLEELNCKTAFTIPLFGGIGVSESVVMTWIMMVVTVAASIWLTKDLKIRAQTKRQMILEYVYTWLHDFFYGIVGENGKRYIPYLMTTIVYLAVANTVVAVLGFKPPTKDMNVTLALALMSSILVIYANIHQRGVKGWLKSLTEPLPLVTPINILEIFTRPLSLCMRLFGNVLGAFVIMKLIELIVPVFLPIPFSAYFDVFDGLIQAYVFVFLTSLYLGEAVEG